MTYTDHSPKPLLRFRWNYGFIAVILLTLGLDIGLAYTIYRIARIFW